MAHSPECLSVRGGTSPSEKKLKRKEKIVFHLCLNCCLSVGTQVETKYGTNKHFLQLGIIFFKYCVKN